MMKEIEQFTTAKDTRNIYMVLFRLEMVGNGSSMAVFDPPKNYLNHVILNDANILMLTS